MRDELGESLEHLRMAAAHAAGGAAGAFAPRLDDAKKAASDGFDSFIDTARDGARTANAVAHRGKAKMKKKEAAMTRRRWPMVAGGILIAGTAAGAAGVLISRRRERLQKWNEYAMDTGREKASDPSRDTSAVAENTGQDANSRP